MAFPSSWATYDSVEGSDTSEYDPSAVVHPTDPGYHEHIPAAFPVEMVHPGGAVIPMLSAYWAASCTPADVVMGARGLGG